MFFEDAPAYLSLLPDNWRELIEVKAISGTVEIQLAKLLETIRQGVGDKFPSMASEIGIARWEKMLGVSSPLNNTLKARREAVRAKLMTKPPINLKSFKAVVEAYMGLPVDVELVENFTIMVWYRGESRQPDLKPLFATVYEMIPANLIVQIAYRWVTWGEINANFPTWGDIAGKTWDEVRKTA